MFWMGSSPFLLIFPLVLSRVFSFIFSLVFPKPIQMTHSPLLALFWMSFVPFPALLFFPLSVFRVILVSIITSFLPDRSTSPLVLFYTFPADAHYTKSTTFKLVKLIQWFELFAPATLLMLHSVYNLGLVGHFYHWEFLFYKMIKMFLTVCPIVFALP